MERSPPDNDLAANTPADAATSARRSSPAVSPAPPDVAPLLPPLVLAQLAELDAAERGLVLALLLGAAKDGGVPMAAAHNLAGTSGARCREMVARIEVLPRAERIQLLGKLAREALAPEPAGLENVHPAVLADLLESESTAVLLALAAQGPAGFREVVAQLTVARAPIGDASDADTALVTTASSAARAELLRAVLAPVVSVPAPPPGVVPHRQGRRLATLSPDKLMHEVRAAGAALLGASLRGAGEETLARATAHVGASWSAHVVRAATDGASSADPDCEDRQSETQAVDGSAAADSSTCLAAPFDRARARALVASTAPGDTALATLEKLGVRALADQLRQEDPDVTLSVAQRLPPALRRALIAAAHPDDGQSTRPDSAPPVAR